jgi:hypothetical protein
MKMRSVCCIELRVKRYIMIACMKNIFSSKLEFSNSLLTRPIASMQLTRNYNLHIIICFFNPLERARQFRFSPSV